MSEKTEGKTKERTENPYKDRPFFRRVLWRLFGEEGMVNTLPNSISSTNRLMVRLEETVNSRALSRTSLQYLEMVHLHLVGDGLDQVLRAQEKTNALLQKMLEQQEILGRHLEEVLREPDPMEEGPVQKEEELPDDDTEEQDGGGE